MDIAGDLIMVAGCSRLLKALCILAATVGMVAASIFGGQVPAFFGAQSAAAPTPAQQSVPEQALPRILLLSLPHGYRGNPSDVDRLDIVDDDLREEELADLARLRLPRLKALYLTTNKFTEKALEHICGLPGIEELCVNFQLTSHGWGLLKRMVDLKRLSIRGCRFSREDIQGLAQLQKIEYLSIVEGAMADGTLACLNDMQALNELRLVSFDPRHTKNAGMLARLKRPERLRLSFDVYVEAAYLGMDCLRGNDRVVELDMGATEVTDEGLHQLPSLPNLVQLNLESTKITDMGLRHLASISKLERLTVTRTQITDKGLAHLEGLTRLKVLGLQETRISGAGLGYLREMKNLEELDLSDTGIDNDGLAYLGALKRLRRLDLSGCPGVGEAGLMHLAGLENLEWLCVNNTYVRKLPDGSIEDRVLLSQARVLQVLSPIKGLRVEFRDDQAMYRWVREGPPGARPLRQVGPTTWADK
jgi:Leucine-rich repeat (LRR) protein